MTNFTKEQITSLNRNLSALQRIILNLKAHDTICEIGYPSNINIMRLAKNALYNDMIALTMNVLDTHKNARGFWWLYKNNKNDIHDYVKTRNIDWDLLENVSRNLKEIRNKTHFHFSREYALDYKQVWKDQNIKGDDFLKVIHSIWDILCFLASKQADISIPTLEYDGEDAKKAAVYVLSLYGLK